MKLFTCAQTGLVRDADAERADYLRISDTVRLASESLREAEIARVCSQHELESDEFMTAREKAFRIMGVA